MRGKKSSNSSKLSRNGGGLEIDNLQKLKEPHLSGAYIRSLVKQLTSSRTKDSLQGDGISTNLSENIIGDDQLSDHHTKQGKSQSQSPKPHKKQVRRRLHTSRPYQERLLNMAEARREIVTALKFHRASMKKHQQLESGYNNFQPLDQSSSDHQLSLEHEEAKLKSRRNQRIYASNSFCSPYTCPVSSINPPPFFQESVDFSLPSQTLGLNLNLQDFTNLDTSSLYCGSNPSSIYSCSSSSAANEENPCAVRPPFGDLGLHQAMDDKEMEEIRSIGEQHQVEWNDTVNLMSSACWFKFLKAMEIDQKADDHFVNSSSPFDEEVMEFPPWLINPNEHLNDYCSGGSGYSQDPALPCMDIEEIEGIDGDWLA